jgi:hypothetical protein
LVQPKVAKNRLPDRSRDLLFDVKAALLKVRRLTKDLVSGVHRHAQHPITGRVVAESKTTLWTDINLAEANLQMGKVENLRIAARRLNGVVIPSGEVFSFWKELGRATTAKGYVRGRQLREGCLYPEVGGGLCQLSNALYSCALDAGLAVVERHPHTNVVPGSAAEFGRDATVSWNYIDLRFTADFPWQIEVSISSTELIVRFHSASETKTRPEIGGGRSLLKQLRMIDDRAVLDPSAHSCVSCGQSECYRHSPAQEIAEEADAVGAFLVNEKWPEWVAYLKEEHSQNDLLLLPLNGQKLGRDRYAWPTDGYKEVRDARWQTLIRAYRARKLSSYGAARLAAQLDGDEALARKLARNLTHQSVHITVAQSYLPFLWRDGNLGGRTFDVLMTRLPLYLLHDRLDAAARAFPTRKTLAEFRAPDWLVEAEKTALLSADRIVTPHSEIAQLFGDKAKHIPWQLPKPREWKKGQAILFPGPTAARKGAYEIREVAKQLDLEILTLGSELEGPDFWSGVRHRRLTPAEDWADGIAAVVQPALVEDRPRILLEAVASNVPIISTDHCGVNGLPNVTRIEFGNVQALATVLERYR